MIKDLLEVLSGFLWRAICLAIKMLKLKQVKAKQHETHAVDVDVDVDVDVPTLVDVSLELLQKVRK